MMSPSRHCDGVIRTSFLSVLGDAECIMRIDSMTYVRSPTAIHSQNNRPRVFQLVRHKVRLPDVS
jgi:hypothetical protein